MQLEVDSLQMELKKKDTVIAVCNTEKERTFERLKDEEGTYIVFIVWYMIFFKLMATASVVKCLTCSSQVW